MGRIIPGWPLDVWCRLDGPIDEADPVHEVKNPPYRFVHKWRHVACEVVVTDVPRSPDDPDWIAGFKTFKPKYLFHAEAGFGGGPSVADLSRHQAALEARFQEVEARLPLPADLPTEGLGLAPVHQGIRAILDATAPLIDRVFMPVPEPGPEPV